MGLNFKHVKSLILKDIFQASHTIINLQIPIFSLNISVNKALKSKLEIYFGSEKLQDRIKFTELWQILKINASKP